MAEAQTLLSGETELAATNTAQKLVTESQIITGLLIRANVGNTAVVRIASPTASATSYPMEAGESIQFDVVDPSRISLFGKEKDKVSYLGLVP